MKIRSDVVERGGLRRGGWQTGCLIALGVVVLLVAAAGITLMLTWKRIAAAGINAVTQQVVSTSSLPKDQQDRIVAKVHSVTDDFVAGKITKHQFGQLAQTVSTSPLIPLGMALAAEKRYFPKSGLPEAERDEGRKALRRLARGVADEKLGLSEMQTALSYISIMRGPNNYELKQTLTDEELRKFLAEVKDRADKAGVAEDAAELNIADEIEKVIDKALAEKA